MRVPGTGSASRFCSGKRKPSSLRRSSEHPCVSRLRSRRLLAFLSRHGFNSTFEAMVQETTVFTGVPPFAHETNVFFSIEHLQRLVFLGQWDDAKQYVLRFVPSVHVLGSEGVVFYNFLQMHKSLHSLAAGEPNGALMAEYYERKLKKYPNSDPGTVKLTRVLLDMLRCKHLRASIDWSCMRFKATEIVKDLITKTPEFNDLLRLPNWRDKPHNILPIGSCLPSSSHCEDNSVVSGLSCEESTCLADAIVESVQAGICRVALHWHSFEDSCNEVESVQAGIRRVALKGHSFENSCSEDLKHTVITGYSGGEVSLARNNTKKRPLNCLPRVQPQKAANIWRVWSTCRLNL